MKVLGIVGSPRLHGNTEIIVQEVLDSVERNASEAGLKAEVELYSLRKKNISFCDACFSCRTTGKCKINDDMQELYPKLLAADGLVVGSPVWAWNISGQTLTFLNRTLPFSFGRKLRDKVVGAVLTTGRAGCSASYDSLLRYFTIQRLIIAGGVFAYGGMEIGAVREDKRAMDEARALGRVVVRYIHRLHSAERIQSLEQATDMARRGYPRGQEPEDDSTPKWMH